MISLTNASGDPVSSFGTGNSAFAQGQQTNPGGSTPGATFGQQARSGLSNAGFSANTPSPTSQVLAGNTQSFGYSSLGGQSRGARRGGAMGGGGGVGGASGMGGSQSAVGTGLGTSEEIGIPDVKSDSQGGDGVQQVRIMPEDEYQRSQQGAGFWDGIKRVQQGAQRAKDWMSSSGPEDASGL